MYLQINTEFNLVLLKINELKPIIASNKVVNPARKL
jgi:hypothetical protein